MSALGGWLRRVWFGSPAPAVPDTPNVEAVTHDEALKNADDAWALLSLVNEWVKHAEAKLGVVLAFVGVMAAGLIAIASDTARPTQTVMIMELITALLILSSAVLAALGLLPRFKGQPEAARMNPLFYGDVAKHFKNRPDEYLTHLSEVLQSRNELAQQIIRQVFANSSVAHAKYVWANRAILVGALGLVALFVLAALQVLSC